MLQNPESKACNRIGQLPRKLDDDTSETHPATLGVGIGDDLTAQNITLGGFDCKSFSLKSESFFPIGAGK